MSEVYTIWWIDDRGDSQDTASVLDEQSENIVVRDIPPEGAVDRVGLIEEDSDDTTKSDQFTKPDMALIDWKLYEQGNYTGKGTSMLGLLRDKFGRIPIYGFSAEPRDINQEQFLRVFNVEYFTYLGAAEDLIEDIRDFEKIDQQTDQGLDGLISTLEPPEDQIDKLKPIIPRELSDGISGHEDGEIAGLHQFTEWVWKRFLHTPGPVLDDQWTATKLGLTREAFQSKKEALLEAEVDQLKYTGVLSPEKDRWWKSSIVQALMDIDKERGGEGKFETTWKKGADLFAESKDELAHCEVCEKILPETVAAPSPNSDERKPVHHRCSDIHHSREGSFADFRIFSKSD